MINYYYYFIIKDSMNSLNTVIFTVMVYYRERIKMYTEEEKHTGQSSGEYQAWSF